MPTSQHQCLDKSFCLKKNSSFALPALDDLSLNIVIQEECIKEPSLSHKAE